MIADEGPYCTGEHRHLAPQCLHFLLRIRHVNPGVLDALSHVLCDHSSATNAVVVQSSAATLFSLLISESHCKTIGSKWNILYALINIVKNPISPATSITDALMTLFGVALYQPTRASIFDMGVVLPLFSLVVNNINVGLIEDAMAVIAHVAGCTIQRRNAISVLVDLIDSVTGSSGSFMGC